MSINGLSRRGERKPSKCCIVLLIKVFGIRHAGIRTQDSTPPVYPESANLILTHCTSD